MKKAFKFLIVLCLVAIAAALAVKPERYLPVCLQGLNLWATKVLPSLLPFLFVTLLLTSFCDISRASHVLSPATRFLYGTSGIAAFVRIVGLISGYPAGAKLVANLSEEGLIDKNEATKIAVLSSTSGPSFVIGTVGVGFFADKKVGVIMFLSHIFAAAIAAAFFRKYGDNRRITPHLMRNTKEKKKDLYATALDSSLSMLCVGTLITVFYVISEIAADLRLTFPITAALNFILQDAAKVKAVTAGLFECTKGCYLLSSCAKSAPLCCAIVSFGGLSVLAQSAAFLQKADVCIPVFVAGKLIQTVLSFFLCLTLCNIFGF